MPPFNLEITIHGLCLMAPRNRDAQNPDRMYVVMPDTTPGSSPVPRHEPMLVYDQIYEGRGKPGLRMIPLAGRELEFPNLPRAGAALALPPGIVNLTRVTRGGQMPTDNLDGNPRNEVASRVVLADGGIAGVGHVACWEFPLSDGTKEPHPMTDYVYWNVAVNDDHLDWQLNNLMGAVGANGVPLVPVNGVIELEVHHVHLMLPTGRPNPGTPAGHFRGFYKPVKHGPERPVPRFVRDGMCHTDADDRAAALALLDLPSPSLYSCMVAGVEVP